MYLFFLILTYTYMSTFSFSANMCYGSRAIDHWTLHTHTAPRLQRVPEQKITFNTFYSILSNFDIFLSKVLFLRLVDQKWIERIWTRIWKNLKKMSHLNLSGCHQSSPAITRWMATTAPVPSELTGMLIHLLIKSTRYNLNELNGNIYTNSLWMVCVLFVSNCSMVCGGSFEDYILSGRNRG